MLTTLSKVEGESRFFQLDRSLDAPRIVVRGRILKSGMTLRKQTPLISESSIFYQSEIRNPKSKNSSIP
jgi:hypothetical protein